MRKVHGWGVWSLAAIILVSGCGGDTAKMDTGTGAKAAPKPNANAEVAKPDKGAVVAGDGPMIAQAPQSTDVPVDPNEGAVVSRSPRKRGPAPTEPARIRTVPPGTKLKLAFICNNASNFWLIAQKGIQKAEQEFDLAVTFLQPPKGTVEEQNKFLEDLVVQGYHGIAISPIAPEGQKEALNRAAARTILITQDSDAPTSNRAAYIGTNNFEAGQALGKEIVRLLPKGGKMAVFVGTFSAENARQRLAGIEDAVAGKDITIVARKEDNKDSAKAAANVEDVLNAIPDVNILAGLWSYNAPKIAAALKAKKGAKPFGVGFDEDQETLKAIEEGVLDCTVVQKPFEFGYQSVKLLQELATKGKEALPADGKRLTGIDVITKKNVVEFRNSLPK